MKPALQLAASLRKMASGVPLLSDEERQDVNEAADVLAKVVAFAKDMKDKSAACKGLATDPKRLDTRENRTRLAWQASTYDDEARRLREILGKTEAAQSEDFDDEPTKERKR